MSASKAIEFPSAERSKLKAALDAAPPPEAIAIRVSLAEEAHIDAMRLRSYHLARQRRHING